MSNFDAAWDSLTDDEKRSGWLDANAERERLRAELKECEVLKWTAGLAEKEVGSDLFGRLRWAAVQHAKDQEELERLRADRDNWRANAETGLNGLIERCEKLAAINTEMAQENAKLRSKLESVAAYCRDMACRCPIPVVEWLVSVAKQIEVLLANPGADA